MKQVQIAPSSAPVSTGDDVVIAAENTRVRFPPGACKTGVLLVADPNNSANGVNVGGEEVTSSAGGRQGIILTPAGMTPVLIPVADSSQLYLNGTTVGDRVSFLRV